MTREEQIDEAATKAMVEDFEANPDGYHVSPYSNNYTVYDAFQRGAEWADDNPAWQNDDDPLHHQLIRAYAELARLKKAVSEAKELFLQINFGPQSVMQKSIKDWLSRHGGGE